MLEWDVWLFAAVLTKFVIYISSFLAVGSLLFLWMLKPVADVVHRPLLRISLIAATVSVICTIFRISLQAGQLYDDGFVGLYDTEMIGLVLDGPLGMSSYVRLVGLGLLFVAILRPAIRIPLTLMCSIIVASSFAFVGHATKELFMLGPLISVHLIAVSYWLGGLYPLHKLASSTDEVRIAGELAHKFGKQAAIIVPILIIVGIAFALYLVGSPIDLIGTEYGLLLLIKVAVVAVLLALAALNKLRFVPAMLDGHEGAAHQLRKSIRVEFAAFLIIFAITAVLTSAVNLPDM